MSLLDLGNNDISRYLPSFAPLTKLVVLSLTNNDLEGPISKSLEELISLQTLDLSNNELSGNVLNVANLTSLQTVRLDGNKLNGEVHTSFGDLPLLGEFMRYLIAFLLSYHTDHASSLLCYRTWSETLNIQKNQLTGSIDFMCQDLPINLELDCEDEVPEVKCNCCVGCTIVSEVCDPENEVTAYLNITVGQDAFDFQWELHSIIDPFNYTEVLFAAGGQYEDGERVDIQLCLAFPGAYVLYTSANITLDSRNETEVVFTVGDYSETLVLFDMVEVDIEPDGSVPIPPSLTPVPSPSSASIELMTSSPTSLSTPTVGTNKTLAPTMFVTLPLQDGSTERPVACLKFELNLTTDAFGDETSWYIYNQGNSTAALFQTVFDSNETYLVSHCLDPRGCYDWVIRDQWNDGIGFPGGFSVSVNDRVIKEGGGAFSSDDIVPLGGRCGVDPTAGTSCPENYGLLNVTILSDVYNQETSWEVFDTSTGQVIALNEYKLVPDTLQTELSCIPERDCSTFAIYDSYGDGLTASNDTFWVVEYRGSVVAEGGGDFGNSSLASFGSICLTGDSRFFYPSS